MPKTAGHLVETAARAPHRPAPRLGSAEQPYATSGTASESAGLPPARGLASVDGLVDAGGGCVVAWRPGESVNRPSENTP